jgi:hypothetical protein
MSDEVGRFAAIAIIIQKRVETPEQRHKRTHGVGISRIPIPPWQEIPGED